MKQEFNPCSHEGYTKPLFDTCGSLVINGRWRLVKRQTCTTPIQYVWQSKHFFFIVAVINIAASAWSSQTKDYKIVMCFFSAKHPSLMKKGKDWVVRK